MYFNICNHSTFQHLSQKTDLPPTSCWEMLKKMKASTPRRQGSEASVGSSCTAEWQAVHIQSLPSFSFRSVIQHWCYRYISFTFIAAYTDPSFKLIKVFLKITLARYREAPTSRSSSSIPSLLLEAKFNPNKTHLIFSYRFCRPHSLSNPQTQTSPSSLTCTSPGVVQLLFTGRRKGTQ